MDDMTQTQTYEIIGLAPGARVPDGVAQRVVRGRTALDVFEAMRDHAPFMAGHDVGEYMANLCGNLERDHGLTLLVDHDASLADRADALLAGLLGMGLRRPM